jgi:hypothetical protein
MVPLHGTCLLEVRAASLGRQDSGGLILSHLLSAPVASRYSPQSAATAREEARDFCKSVLSRRVNCGLLPLAEIPLLSSLPNTWNEGAA